MNCWEFKNCGSENECPAHPNNGKICFSVAKTLCDGVVQGDYQAKCKYCRECDYYKKHVMKK